MCVSGSAEERGSGPSGAPGGAHLSHRVHAFYPPPALLAAEVPRRAPPGSNVCINTSLCCFVIYSILKYFCLGSFSVPSRDLFSRPSVSISTFQYARTIRSRHILDIVLNIFQFKIFMSVLISQSAHKSAGIHINVSFNGPYLRSAAERGEGLFICFETESYRLQNALLVPPAPSSPSRS